MELLASLPISHDAVRWLDDLRHYAASSLNGQAVGGNTGAAIYWTAFAGITTAILWPPLRERIHAELSHLHAKLDHIVEHHPDIPPFPGGKGSLHEQRKSQPLVEPQPEVEVKPLRGANGRFVTKGTTP